MIEIEATAGIDATAAQVWAVLADYGRDVEWRSGVRSMVPTPAGTVRAGTTTVEWMRAAGRTMRNDGVVTDVVDGRRFAWRTTAGVVADGTREVIPDGDGGCTVRVVQRVRPPGMLRLVAGPLRRSLRRRLVADVGRLRALVELTEEGITDEGLTDEGTVESDAPSGPGPAASRSTSGSADRSRDPGE